MAGIAKLLGVLCLFAAAGVATLSFYLLGAIDEEWSGGEKLWLMVGVGLYALQLATVGVVACALSEMAANRSPDAQKRPQPEPGALHGQALRRQP